MKQLYQERIQPHLLANYSVKPWQLITIKTIGIGESDIQQRLESLKLPEQVQLSFRTSSVENQTKLLFPPEFSRSELETISKQVAKLIGDPVFTIEGIDENSGDLITILSHLLTTRKLTLAVAETISQGQIASHCIGENWLIESLFCRDTLQLARKLDLPNMELAVEEEQRAQLAITFARQLKTMSGADIGLAQLYFQDQTSTTLLYTALVSATDVKSQLLKISGPIRRQQNRATLHALDYVRRFVKDN